MVGASDRELWEAMPIKMESWVRKGEMVKSSRWFSWNECMAKLLPEWTCARMLLHWYHQDLDEQAPDSRRGISWSQAGGLKLVFLCHGYHNWELSQILLRVQEPLHQWYSHEVHFVKTPPQGFECLLDLVTSDAWMQDWTLRGICECLHSGFNDMSEWVEDLESFAMEAGKYALAVLGNRCSSLAAKCASPPESYIGLFNGREHQAMDLMKSDWSRLVALEKCSVSVRDQLVTDLNLTFDATVRLCVQVFEAEGFDQHCAEGRDLLYFLCANFADTKLIEDVHQKLRNSASNKSNDHLSASCIQEIIVNSMALEERQIDHPAAITRAEFIRVWHTLSADFKASQFKSKSHKLPPEFGNILGKKVWPTYSEVDFTFSSAAWAFFRYYCDHQLASHGISLEVRLF